MLAEIEAEMRSLETMDAGSDKRYDEDISRRTRSGHVTARGLRHGSVMSDAVSGIKQPVVEIDNRSKRLTGCMTCNIWWSIEGEKVRLSRS